MQTNINKIQVFQNKVLCIAVNAAWFVVKEQIRNELTIPYINTSITGTTKKYFKNAKHSESELIHNLGKKEFTLDSETLALRHSHT